MKTKTIAFALPVAAALFGTVPAFAETQTTVRRSNGSYGNTSVSGTMQIPCSNGTSGTFTYTGSLNFNVYEETSGSSSSRNSIGQVYLFGQSTCPEGFLLANANVADPDLQLFGPVGASLRFSGPLTNAIDNTPLGKVSVSLRFNAQGSPQTFQDHYESVEGSTRTIYVTQGTSVPTTVTGSVLINDKPAAVAATGSYGTSRTTTTETTQL